MLLVIYILYRYHCPAQSAEVASLQLKAALFSSDFVDTLHSTPYNFDSEFDVTSFSFIEFR